MLFVLGLFPHISNPEYIQCNVTSLFNLDWKVVVELKGENMAKFRLTLLRGRRTGSYIEIIEFVEVESIEQAVNEALEIAKRNKWHIEKVERVGVLPVEDREIIVKRKGWGDEE